jgi:hypothetical protein
MTQEELFHRLANLLVSGDLSGFKTLLLEESGLIRQEDFQSYLALVDETARGTMEAS